MQILRQFHVKTMNEEIKLIIKKLKSAKQI